MNVGIVIGRFQIHALHDAHKRLLWEVNDKHPNVVVFIGVAPLANTKRDPLSYELRAQMIREAYPNVITIPLLDMESDKDWSTNIDRTIATMFPGADATLYCGKDGFVDHYHGKYKVTTIPTSWPVVNATDIRNRTGDLPQYNEMFRAGIIYSTQRQFGSVLPAVDIALVRDLETPKPQAGNEHSREILLGRKENEYSWRLPGGMVDSTDDSYEAAARRELFEETGMTVESKLLNIGSHNVPDWRMDKTGLACMTTLFVASYFAGIAKPGDDLFELQWFSLSEFNSAKSYACISPGHRKLINAVREFHNFKTFHKPQ